MTTFFKNIPFAVKFKLPLLLTLTALTGGCAFHSGQLVADVPPAPVEHRDIAVGIASTTKVLWMGGLDKDALIHEARQEMIHNRPLVDDESYNNYSIDFKRSYFFIGTKTKVTITADVIAPKDTITLPSYTSKYLSEMNEGYSRYDTLFQIGDSVLFGGSTFQYGEILGFDGRDNARARIQYRNSDGIVRVTTVTCSKVFVLLSHYRGNRRRLTTEEGNTVAFGLQGAVLKSEDSYFFRYY